ncbi:hypothetical protein LV85_04408 [Algoriphagus chordae]|uniref:Uncharacterized protein n=1 Tax=Algoriphagus chordae TaxID=237019 RepID=A0A2W7QJ60_9BACT|nr:hypothetical protein LV85_04408 [Algoriphagus chordae]
MKFLRTLSYRDILSSFLSAIMMVSLIFLLKQIRLFDSYYILFGLIIFVPVFIKHRLYYLEHKRRNRIFGRLLHDVITIVWIVIIASLSLKIVGKFHRIGSYTNLMIASFTAVLLAEIGFSIINQVLLRVFKIRVC